MPTFRFALLALGLLPSAVDARPMTVAEKRAVEAVVKEHLKDPRSAMFKHPALQIEPGPKGGAMYCGLVNSKNSYGGYAGDAIFMAGFFTELRHGKPITTAKFVTMGDADPSSEDSQVAAKACAKVPHYTTE